MYGSPGPFGGSTLAAALAAAVIAVMVLLVWRDQQARRRRAREAARPDLGTGADRDATPSRYAPATRYAAIVIAIVSIAAWVFPEALLVRLAKDNHAIRSGELWRLVTVMLVHGSLLHLFMNDMVLLDVGTAFERLVGPARLLLVLVVGTAAGTAASVAFIEAPSVGASGGVLAIMGALLAFGFRHRDAFPPEVRGRFRRAMLQLVLLNAFITFVVPQVDWAGHAGGFTAGVVLGLLLRPARGTRIGAEPAGEPARSPRV